MAIVSFHWGQEYVDRPSESQIRTAHKAIDAGADLVIGHHSHCLQSVEIYQGKPIFYSLGNLVFDQFWSQATREGLMIRVSFNNDRLVMVRLFPVVINELGQPFLANQAEGSRILSRVRQLSEEI